TCAMIVRSNELLLLGVERLVCRHEPFGSDYRELLAQNLAIRSREFNRSDVDPLTRPRFAIDVLGPCPYPELMVSPGRIGRENLVVLHEKRLHLGCRERARKNRFPYLPRREIVCQGEQHMCGDEERHYSCGHFRSG